MNRTRVDVWGRSDRGRARERNEDAFLVSDLTRGRFGLGPSVRSHEVGPHGSLFAVCDGLGGGPAGEVASRLAIDVILDRMLETRGTSKVPGARLAAALQLAGRRIHELGERDPSRRGMATTATAALVIGSTLFVAQAGDSRAYLAREGLVAQVTHDHSVAQELADAGHAPAPDAPLSHVLSRALGVEPDVAVDLFVHPILHGDVVLLCSDGVWSAVGPEALQVMLDRSRDPRIAVHAIVESAIAAGSVDDVTAIVARFEGDALVAALPGEAPIA